MTTNVLSEKLKDKTWCVIPVFNNAATIADVAERCRKVLDKVLVVDDGSTDTDLKSLFAGSDIELIQHPENRGKGAALLSALDFLVKRDAGYMITIDGDGQHYPEDIPLFFPFMEKNDYSMLIGCRDFSAPNITGASRRGRALANFWMQVETGLKIDDCQSGFRAYPVKYVAQLKFICRHYNFETEVLVRAAWAGLEFHCVTVRTWYEEPEKRISHFKPFLDTFRISCIHAHLTACRLLPLPHKKLVKKQPEKSLNSFIR
jgi:glycosyltransferase involved in cell wall biosynthesis